MLSYKHFHVAVCLPSVCVCVPCRGGGSCVDGIQTRFKTPSCVCQLFDRGDKEMIDDGMHVRVLWASATEGHAQTNNRTTNSS